MMDACEAECDALGSSSGKGDLWAGFVKQTWAKKESLK